MKKLTDTHSHCYPASHDAKSSLPEMLSAAIGKNISYYGISNHVDYDYDEMQMGPEERVSLKNGDPDKFFAEARSLQKKHEKDITFLVGAELGFAPDMCVQEKYVDFICRYQPDYIINSVHSANHKDYCRSEISRDKKEVFSMYLKTVRESLDAIYHYDIVGHIEYIVRYVPFENKQIDISEFQEQVDDILQIIIDKNKILELNTATYSDSRICFPNQDILKRYFELGGRNIAFGSDAHSPERLLDKRDEAVVLLCDIGFTHITVPCRGEYIKIPL